MPFRRSGAPTLERQSGEKRLNMAENLVLRTALALRGALDFDEPRELLHQMRSACSASTATVLAAIAAFSFSVEIASS
jgi:hypothetical protein